MSGALTDSSTLSRDGVLTLLQAGPAETQALFAAADLVRGRNLGGEVHLRGIIEFSNCCVNNCRYCGLRRDNGKVARYRLEPAEILAAAREAAALGVQTIVLQSGEDPCYTADMLAGIIQRLKEELAVAVTLSVGDRSKDDYRLLRRAGADRYLLKHETAAPGLFARLRPGTTLTGRLKHLHWLKELGYQVGSGNMVGLPGQTLSILAEDIMLLKELGVEMAGIGPFIPHPDTPLAGHPAGDLDLTLKALAVTRLLLPQTHLPATTALGSIHPDGRRRGLLCGANVIMPNVTPLAYRARYQIYPGKTGLHTPPLESVNAAKTLIQSLDRQVGAGYGHACAVKPGTNKKCRLDGPGERAPGGRENL
nr:[FeFe] hydrogenase H-cluster radical SAM maturase HydE [Desulfotomaculum copahuensis]